jgi:hypothetical protein
MKAVISSTHDNQYFFYLPIVTWLWNKLGVGVVCFMPKPRVDDINFLNLVSRFAQFHEFNQLSFFDAPEHKEATYAQCSRLYAATLNLPEDEVLVVSDIDMAVFNTDLFHTGGGFFNIVGYDLVPDNQYPMCYLVATVKAWRDTFELKNGGLQESLDSLLGGIECDNFRGNYWAKDQEEAHNKIKLGKRAMIARARPGTQFATNRLDRDDAFILERLSPDIIDYHMNRPGYTDDNFEKIITIIKYFYSNDDLQWMIDYRNEYLKLIQ